MPVKKTKKDMEKKQCHNNMFHKRIMLTLVGIMIVYIIVFLATMIRNNIQEYYFIGRADSKEHTVNIQAEGRVVIRPDVVKTTMGMISTADTVEEAQKDNTETMNKLIESLKGLGIEEKDLQTDNYNIYPQYDYTDNGGRVLSGYNVSQNVTIKIRDLSKTNDVIALAGEVGANSVSGLNFSIDDPRVYKEEARKLAIEEIIKKAKELSRLLGVRFVSVVSYNEYSNDFGGTSPMFEAKAMGIGGSFISPDIESGSEEVQVSVDIVFEIL